ncbi:MAG: NlpC/P60 family protein [Segniliparus sp.]|uniref:NlpC/P60 family protein n=1 Tax=Segniliparus sp. TaxID=2804064 RepID=UPI003F2CCA22
MRRAPALAVSALVFFGTATSLAAAEPAAPPSANQQQTVNSAIARALAQRGVPYVYGGGSSDGPTGNPAGSGIVGFDASGLMVYAFAGAGAKLPRSSKDQYQAGRKIWPSQALPGDLIFYGPEGSESVAMFLGNGQMLEATNPSVAVSRVRTNGMAPYVVRILG